MDAVSFLKERKRMCDSYKRKQGGHYCYTCTNDFGRCWRNNDQVDGREEEAVQVVEEWSKAHPVMTNGLKFLKTFGVQATDGTILFEKDGRYSFNLEWWNAPYQERGEE